MNVIITVFDVIAWVFSIACEVVGIAVAVAFFVALFCMIMAFTDRG